MRILKPVAAVLAAGLLYGCASSGDAMDSTANEESRTMSETQTMAGNDEAVETEETTETEVTTDVEADTMAATDMDANADPSSMAILDVARSRSDISTFMSLIDAANIAKALQGQGEFTMFAPTNEAFEQLPAGQLEFLKKPENRSELIKVLQAHIIANKVTTAQLQGNQRIQVSDTDFIEVGTGAGPNDFTIGGATIIEPNVETANGVIHIVDRVLVTADAVQDKE